MQRHLLSEAPKSELREKTSRSGQPVATTDHGTKMALIVKASDYIECSAVTGEGIKNVFEEVVRAVNDNAKRKGKTKVCSIQ